MSDFIIALMSEQESVAIDVQRLSQEVAAAQQRLKVATDKADRLLALLSAYEAEEKLASAVNVHTVNLPPVRLQTAAAVAARFVHPTQLSKKQAMEREVESMLAGRPGLHRSVILGGLLGKGIMGSEKDPMAHLAAFLSDHRHKFVSDGKGNFDLRRNGHTEPQPAQTDSAAGSVGVGNAVSAAPPESQSDERSVVS
jgi:hypothetical protein